jgi:chitodextrinase
LVTDKGVCKSVVSGLVNGTSYTFTAVAVDASGNRSAGVSVAGAPKAPVEPGAPDEVSGLSVQAGNCQVVLSWTDPTSLNLSHIEITRDGAGGSIPLIVASGKQKAIAANLTNGVAYLFTLRTVSSDFKKSNGVQVSCTPATGADTTPPGPVTGITAAPENGQVLLAWTDPSDADLGHIEISTDPVGIAPTLFVDPGIKTATVNGLTNGTVYTISLVAVDTSGNRSTAATATATPLVVVDTTPPAEVSSLAAVPGDAYIQLSWIDPTAPDFNHVEITRTGSGGTVPIIVGAGVQAALVGGLANGASYAFTVRTVDASGNKSAGSSIPANLPLDTTPPAEVSSLATTPGVGFMTLSWTDPSDSDFNHVEITHADAGGSTPVVIAKGLGTASITALAYSTSYTFIIKTVDNAGNKSTGAAKTATTLAPDTAAPAEVSSLTAAPGDTQIALAWVDPTDSDLNHIEITRTGSGGTTAVIVGAGVQTAVLGGLSSGTSYTFTVRTVDNSGNKSTGTAKTATTLAPDTTPPAEVSSLVATPGLGLVTLTWVDPTTPDFNHLELTRSGGTGAIIVNKGTGNAVITGLATSTSYTFMVKTVDNAGNKSEGVTRTATTLASDTTPPAEVSALAAAAGNGQVSLQWVDPVDSDFNHVEITYDQAGGGTPKSVGSGMESALITGLRDNLAYTFTLRTADGSGNLSAGVAIQATPTSGSGSLDVTLAINVPSDLPISLNGNSATLNKLAAQTMNVEAVVAGATDWAWYLDGDSTGTDASTAVVSSASLSLGWHKLSVVVSKGGLLYSAELGFTVVNS